MDATQNGHRLPTAPEAGAPLPHESVLVYVQRATLQQGGTWTHADAAAWERALRAGHVPSHGAAQDWVDCVARVSTLVDKEA